jgi:CheY-like chemotaxis protein
MRILLATPDSDTLDLMSSLLDVALGLVPLDVCTVHIAEQNTLQQQTTLQHDDVILLDWQLAGADTPDFVRQIFAIQPLIRVIALLPDHLRQYRQRIWEAGACCSIPLERIDQEWLSSALCIMSRAIDREARLADTLYNE